MLVITDLQLRAGNAALFAPLTASLDAGECLGITGTSGIGKTTLLRALADRGKSKTIYTGSMQVDHPPLFVPQERALPAGYRVGKLINLLASGAAIERRQKVLEALEIADLTHRYVGELSGGEAKKLAIAIALLNYPALLVLDEPFANLDLPAKLRVAAFLEEQLVARSCQSIVIVSHDLETLLMLSDRIVLLARAAENVEIRIEGERPRGIPFIKSAEAARHRATILDHLGA